MHLRLEPGCFHAYHCQMFTNITDRNCSVFFSADLADLRMAQYLNYFFLPPDYDTKCLPASILALMIHVDR